MLRLWRWVDLSGVAAAAPEEHTYVVAPQHMAPQITAPSLLGGGETHGTPDDQGAEKPPWRNRCLVGGAHGDLSTYSLRSSPLLSKPAEWTDVPLSLERWAGPPSPAGSLSKSAPPTPWVSPTAGVPLQKGWFQKGSSPKWMISPLQKGWSPPWGVWSIFMICVCLCVCVSLRCPPHHDDDVDTGSWGGKGKPGGPVISPPTKPNSTSWWRQPAIPSPDCTSPSPTPGRRKVGCQPPLLLWLPDAFNKTKTNRTGWQETCRKATEGRPR